MSKTNPTAPRSTRSGVSIWPTTFSFNEQPAQQGLDAKHRKQTLRYPKPTNVFGRIDPRKVGRPVVRCTHGLERMAQIAPVNVVCDGHWTAAVHQNGHQSSGILVRQRAEQHRVHNTKDRRVRSNAERQCDHGNCRKTRSTQHRTHAVAQVLEQSFHKRSATRLPALFFGAFEAAEFEACAAHGFLARNTAANQVFGIRFQMETELGVHFAFHARREQSNPHPGTETAPKHHTSSCVVLKMPAITSAIRFHLSVSVCNLRFPAALSW